MGTYNSIRLWKLLVPVASDTSFLALRVRDAGRIRWLYLILNLAANSLNFVSRSLLKHGFYVGAHNERARLQYWFRLMLLALKKR